MGIDIEKIKSGNPAELNRLAKFVAEAIHVVVRSYVHNNEDAEEIIQDTILISIERIDMFDTRSSLKTWVYRIAINKSKDLLKFRGRIKRSGTKLSLDNEDMISSDILRLGDYYHPGKMLESKEQLDILFSGINQLPASQREALTLIKFEQLRMKEVASIMDITPKAVEGLISRSKQNLKKFLETEGFIMNNNRRYGK